MKVGMLWFDNDPKKTLKAKVIEAADYYRNKYGQVPTTCMVNPHELGDDAQTRDEIKVGRVSVQAMRAVAPGHLWIGQEENDRQNNKART